MKKKKIVALTLGLSLAVGSLTGAYTMAQANEKPAEMHTMQRVHARTMYDNINHQEMLTLLQIDEETFKQEADSGKSLMDIASAHNVSRQAVVDLVVRSMNHHIDKDLSEKRITEDQAKEMKTNAEEKAQQMIKRQPMGPMGPMGPMVSMGSDKMHGPNNKGHERPMHDRQNPQAMLALLQIDEQTFKQEADSGKSLAEIAAAHNVSRQAVIDLVVKNMNEQIDKGLAEKRITVEQAKEMKTNAVEKSQKMVDMKPMGLDKRQGPRHDRQSSQEMLTLLKIDEQTFQQEQRSGKSLAQIGAAHNVSRQAIIDLVVKNMNQHIDKGVAEERITAEQAAEMKANAVEKAQEMVDKNMMEQPSRPAQPHK